MGTSPDDCRSIGRLIGLKTFTNEFVAYDELSKIIKNKPILDSYMNSNYTDWYWKGDNIILPQLNDTVLKYGILEASNSCLLINIFNIWKLCHSKNCIEVPNQFIFKVREISQKTVLIFTTIYALILLLSFLKYVINLSVWL